MELCLERLVLGIVNQRDLPSNYPRRTVVCRPVPCLDDDDGDTLPGKLHDDLVPLVADRHEEAPQLVGLPAQCLPSDESDGHRLSDLEEPKKRTYREEKV